MIVTQPVDERPQAGVEDTQAQTIRAIAARINGLPMSIESWTWMLLAGIAWLVESFDIGISSSTLPSLQREFALDAFGLGALAIASTLGIVFPVVPAGSMADKIGRMTFLLVGTSGCEKEDSRSFAGRIRMLSHEPANATSKT